MVLVVDDDAMIRETMQLLIEDAGYEVVTAADGMEGIDAMRAHRPCLVVLDLMMPLMTGWQVLAAMKADVRLAEIPVCVVSAFPKHAPLEATTVLPKPVRLNVLLDANRASLLKERAKPRPSLKHP